MDSAGAVLEVEFGDLPPDPLIEGWSDNLLLLLGDLGWMPATPRVLRRTDGASLGFEAPSDLLLTATEINEWAWARAVELTGGTPAERRDAAQARISQLANEERKPRLLALESAAKAHGVSVYQVALAWLLERSPVMLPIPGTSSLAHLEENVAAAKLKLTPEEWKAIDALKS